MFEFRKKEFIFKLIRVDLYSRIFFLRPFGEYLGFRILALPTMVFEAQAHGNARARRAQILCETLGGPPTVVVLSGGSCANFYKIGPTLLLSIFLGCFRLFCSISIL